MWSTKRGETRFKKSVPHICLRLNCKLYLALCQMQDPIGVLFTIIKMRRIDNPRPKKNFSTSLRSWGWLCWLVGGHFWSILLLGDVFCFSSLYFLFSILRGSCTLGLIYQYFLLNFLFLFCVSRVWLAWSILLVGNRPSCNQNHNQATIARIIATWQSQNNWSHHQDQH